MTRMKLGRYRKFIVALLAAAAVIGAELPPDAPDWLTGTFAVLGALGVWAVRNDQPPSRERLKRATEPTTYGGYGSKPPPVDGP